MLFVIFVFVFAYLQITAFHSPQYSNHISIRPVSSIDHTRGNLHATVTIIEYSDFECPTCQYFQPTIHHILHAYANDVRWVIRPYPLPQHVNAEKEAEAAECIASLGGNAAYWKFSELLFSKEVVTQDGTGIPLSKLVGLASVVGVDKKRFSACLNGGKFYKSVQESIADAVRGGINVLPSTIIIDKRGNMQLVVSNQSFAVFKNLLDQDLRE